MVKDNSRKILFVVAALVVLLLGAWLFSEYKETQAENQAMQEAAEEKANVQAQLDACLKTLDDQLATVEGVELSEEDALALEEFEGDETAICHSKFPVENL